METLRLRLAHASMQFSDTAKQMQHDADVVFDRGYDILTGTESGLDNPLGRIIPATGKRHGYRVHRVRTNFVAIREGLLTGGWAEGFVDVLDSSDGVGKHSDRGITWAGGNVEGYGRLTVGCGHYLTKGRPDAPYRPNLDENQRYAEAIGEWAKDKGKGNGLVFYHGDQNIVDADNDTFFGEDLTSAWDELQVWQNTGHGNIDVIASYDPDRRVAARRIRALPDRKVFLNTDHFLVEAVYEVAPKRATR